MALPASGTISINDVNTEFALGQNMNAYRVSSMARQAERPALFRLALLVCLTFIALRR